MSSLERCPLFRVSFKERFHCIPFLATMHIRDLYIRSWLVNCQSKGCNAEETHIHTLHNSETCAIDYPITGIYTV